MFFLRTIKTIIYFCFILLLVTKIVLGEKQYSKEEIIKNARTVGGTNYKSNCFYLSTIKLEEAGFITLHFKQNNEINATKLQKMKAEQMHERFRLTNENGNKKTLDLVKTYKTSTNRGLLLMLNHYIRIMTNKESV